ncbi:hypothetical protein MAC_00577 [Metarhizium acridum CQMa 102]|uniref:Uncharacterized protein n=1 Tax=Metarhizium acridum (strain CQMa 102) TaxID=655827 RepID=E9DSH9_METAQ|nr:uncharacterized protein MAC_00577 [Metarhizium acridum CQMa 102]EFY93339.1 hypothetical protein MAC_00577 [Metarhizium acridum CQMa 102]
MKGRVPKPRACRSHLKLPKAPQKKRLDTIASRALELPPGRGGRSPAGGGVAQDTTLLQSKRPLDPASTNDSSPAKRARLTRTDIHRGPPRRSARLQGQQPASSGNSVPPSRASFGRQIEAGVGTSSLKRPGSTRRNPQTQAEDEQLEQTIETAQQPKTPRRPSNSLLKARVEEQGRVSSATLLRKQQIDSEGGGNEQQLKRARLTRENLAELDNMVKKGANKTLAPTAPESTVASTSIKTTTKTTSSTTSGFAIHAYKNGILDPVSSKPPENLEDIRERAVRSRATASPTESDYRRYVNRVEVAPNEATMVVEVSGQLLKKYDDEGYHQVFNQAFTGFPKDVGFNNGLSVPQPDFIEGLGMREFRPFPVDEHVSGAVFYKDSPQSLTLPHLVGECTGKDMAEAKLQSAYDGAALVYARNQALSYIGKPDPLGHAKVTTFTTDGTNLNLYAHYAAPLPDGTLEYHQYPIKSINLIDSHQGLKDGRRGLRNEQDYARKQSYAMRDQLKEHWKQRSSALHPIAERASPSVADSTFRETNADETGYVVVEQPCQPTPAASSSVLSSKSAPPVYDYVSCSSGHKRKASSSQRPHGSSKSKSKAQEYWKWDAKRGQYFHKHSDGKVTWLEDSDDEN